MPKALPKTSRKTKTVPYDVAEQLRTPEEMAAYLDAWLAEAVRRGWITPPAFASDAAIPRKPIMPFRELARDMEADREDR